MLKCNPRLKYIFCTLFLSLDLLLYFSTHPHSKSLHSYSVFYLIHHCLISLQILAPYSVDAWKMAGKVEGQRIPFHHRCPQCNNISNKRIPSLCSAHSSGPYKRSFSHHKFTVLLNTLSSSFFVAYLLSNQQRNDWTWQRWKSQDWWKG